MPESHQSHAWLSHHQADMLCSRCYLSPYGRGDTSVMTGACFCLTATVNLQRTLKLNSAFVADLSYTLIIHKSEFMDCGFGHAS